MTSRFPGADPERIWAPILVAAGALHLLGFSAFEGIRWDYLLLDGLLIGMAVAGGKSFPLATTAFPLWLTGVLYLNLQPVLLPLRGPILTGGLYSLDAAIFPAPGGSGWPAYFHEHTSTALDLVAGVAYLVYLLQFVLVFLFLFVRDRPDARKMAWCFFLVNVIGITIYLVFPAAPPWYVLAHGMGPADPAAVPSAAGAERFDALLGIRYFHAFYAKNPNVFGAMPSLHVAYPTVAAGFLAKRGVVPGILGVAFAAWVAFAAVYLVHHYVLDVAAGAAVGLAAFGLVERLSRTEATAGGET